MLTDLFFFMLLFDTVDVVKNVADISSVCE